jgi:hypothetical protein
MGVTMSLGKPCTAQQCGPPQFMHVCWAVQLPSVAWYCWHVTSGIPPTLCIHALAALESPPLQPIPEQSRMFWILPITSRPLPLAAILTRSPRDDTGACAQQDPQSEAAFSPCKIRHIHKHTATLT